MGPHIDPEHLRPDKSPVPHVDPRHGGMVPMPGMPSALMPIPYRAQALSATPNALEILVALRRRWLAAAVVGVICAAIVCAVMVYNAPVPFYTGSASIEIRPPSGIIGNFQETKAEFDNFVAKQAGLIMSRTVLQQAARDLAGNNITILAGATDSAERLRQHVRVEFGEAPDVVRIAMNGDQEQEIVLVVGAVTKAFLERAGGWEHAFRQEQIEERRKHLVSIEKRIDVFEKKLVSLSKKDTGPAIPLNIEQRLGIAEKLLSDSKGEMTVVLKRKRTLHYLLGAAITREKTTVGEEFAAAMAMFPYSGSPINLMTLEITSRYWSGYSEAELQQEIQDDAAFQDFIKRINSLEALAAAEALVNPLGERSNDVKTLRRDAIERRQAFTEYAAQLRQQLIDKLRKKAKLEALIEQNKLKTELLELETQQRLLQDDIDYYTLASERVAEVSLEVRRINRHIEAWSKFAEQIKNRIDDMSVELDQPLRVYKRDEAAAMYVDNRPKHWVMTGAAGAGTIALVLLAFGWFEYRARKVNSADEVVQMLGMRLLGALPDYTHRRRLLSFGNGDEEQWQHMLAESVDTARTMLLHAAQTDGLRVVMVTSAMPGEGKTSSATHLAASLARAGRKTLLVDCDLRNPTAHRLFQLSRAPGFADVLQGECDLASAIRESPVEGLSVITAGRTTAIAMQALARGGAYPLFQQLRQQFDFIIVDSCPVLPVADSLVLAEGVDAVIFAVLRDVSRMPRVYEAYRRLAVLGVRTLGAMVSGVRDPIYARGYAYAATEE